MYHKRNIDVVEVSAVEKFTFPAKILDLALRLKLTAVFYFKKLLGGYSAELDFSREIVEHTGLLERRRDTDERRALRIVTAGMHCARFLVRFRVIRADY